MWAVPGGLLAEVPRAKVRGVEVRGVGLESLGDRQTDGWIITHTHTHKGEQGTVTVVGRTVLMDKLYM